MKKFVVTIRTTITTPFGRKNIVHRDELVYALDAKHAAYLCGVGDEKQGLAAHDSTMGVFVREADEPQGGAS